MFLPLLQFVLIAYLLAFVNLNMAVNLPHSQYTASICPPAINHVSTLMFTKAGCGYVCVYTVSMKVCVSVCVRARSREKVQYVLSDTPRSFPR